jgi:uncharacterized membrane-anchored protein
MIIRSFVLLTALLASGETATAQDQQDQNELPQGWTPGPVVGRLGHRATINVPEGYFFLDASATKTFLEMNQNIPDGDELGVIFKADESSNWFAVFSYSDTGYIKDDEKDAIDADALMASMRKGSERANRERAQRGWSALNLEGWHTEPYYDQATHNLTWSTRLVSDGAPVINHSVRLLGRQGLMSAQLVADPESIMLSTIEFQHVMHGYSFNEGLRYAEFRSGDKVAEYGLTALIVGGGAAAAVKGGLFQKAWKAIVLAFFALIGGLKRLFSRKREEPYLAPPPDDHSAHVLR